jgi:hypothetical protein
LADIKEPEGNKGSKGFLLLPMAAFLGRYLLCSRDRTSVLVID